VPADRVQSVFVKTKTIADAPYTTARGLRKTLTPADLAAWNPKLRQKTPQQLIDATLKDRLPDLTAVRYQRMVCSPFTFFRGSAAVMAYDLSLAPHTGIEVQLCGDAHVQNLGAFEGDDGRLIFDINDFDETFRGPFEWDLKRMAASIFLAGRDSKIKPAAVTHAAAQFLTSYAALIRLLHPKPVLEVARYQVHRLDAIAPISEILAQAQRATPLTTLKKLTSKYPKGRIFKTQKPDLVRLELYRESERVAVLASLMPYLHSLLPERRHFFARYTPVDVAFKIVGTGSVGLRDYVVYLEGNGPADPLFLQIKQESASCYAPYLKGKSHQPPNQPLARHQGQRVAEGQRAMQLQSDPLLGWTTIGKHDYLVRQLSDHKASVDLTRLKAADLCEYASVCGEMLARGHARSGDVRQIAGYLGNGKRFTKAILSYAHAYADQMGSDWKTFTKSHKP
jgi:uncharacterized protein (DUF2252 family)